MGSFRLSEAIPIEAGLLGDALYEAATHSNAPRSLREGTTIRISVHHAGRPRHAIVDITTIIEHLGRELKVTLEGGKSLQVTLELPLAAHVMEVIDNHRYYRALSAIYFAAIPLLEADDQRGLEEMAAKLEETAAKLQKAFDDAEANFAEVCKREPLGSTSALAAAEAMNKQIERQRKHRWPLIERALRIVLKRKPEDRTILAATLQFLSLHLLCERVLRVAELDSRLPMKREWFSFSSQIADDLRVLFGRHLVRYIEAHTGKSLIVAVGQKYLTLEGTPGVEVDPLGYYDPARSQSHASIRALQGALLGEQLDVRTIRGARAPFYSSLPGFREARRPIGYLAADYVAYLVVARDGSVYAILDSEDDGNAVYIFRTSSGNWEAEAQRDKRTVLSTKGGGYLHCRMWHNETWQTRIHELLGYAELH